MGGDGLRGGSGADEDAWSAADGEEFTALAEGVDEGPPLPLPPLAFLPHTSLFYISSYTSTRTL